MLERTARDDRLAFEELYRRYARSVLGLALRRFGDRGRAEDAVRETFTRIWRSAARYDASRDDAASWLYALACGDPEARAAVGGTWVSWRVHRALETLPDHERSLVELLYWSGMSPAEVAGFLGIRPETVAARARAALGRLADELQDDLA